MFATGTTPSDPFLSTLKHLLKPLVKQVVHTGLQPIGPLRPVFSGIYRAQWLSRELMEMAHRSLIATPLFLSQCASHGRRISVERIPYLQGPCRIELGNDVRISGKIDIVGDRERSPVLKIGNCVFIGYNTVFALGERIEIGDYVAIGNHCRITDTEGHDRYTDEPRPCWDVRAGSKDISPVVIEDGVWLGQGVCVLKGVRIGARSIIGMNSVVRTDIPPDAVVMGNPARVIPMNLFRPGARNCGGATSPPREVK